MTETTIPDEELTELDLQIKRLKELHEANRDPDEALLGKLPRGTGPRDQQRKGHCDECGGYHTLPAIHLDYMGHADVTEVLLRADPLWNWRPVAFDENGLPRTYTRNGQAVLWMYLTVFGHERLGVGTAPAGKEEVDKELIGDALRNAALRFGIGVHLWSKADGLERSIDDGTAQPDAAGADASEHDQRAAHDRVGWSIDRIRDMSNREVCDELAARKLPTTGRERDRRNRLWQAVCTVQGTDNGVDTNPPATSAAPPATDGAADDPGLPLPDAIAVMPKRELTPFLRDANLSTTGTVADMRQRLIDHLHPEGEGDDAEDGSAEDADGSEDGGLPFGDDDDGTPVSDSTRDILLGEIGKLSGGAARAWMTYKREGGLPHPPNMTEAQALDALEFLEGAVVG